MDGEAHVWPVERRNGLGRTELPPEPIRAVESPEEVLFNYGGVFIKLVPCPDPDWYWLMYGEQFRDADGKHWMRAAFVKPRPHDPDYPDVDPVTGEQVLAQPVTPPADGTPRA